MNQEQIETAARAAYVEMEWPDRITEHDSNRKPDDEYKERAAKRWDEGNAGWSHYRRYRRQAAAVIAAIHPAVSSVEELDALPEGSVIRFIDITPTVAVKDDEGTWCGSHGLNYYGWDDDDPSPVPFPATVLYTPGGAA